MGAVGMNGATPPEGFLTRADRRRLERLQRAVDIIVESDRRFFARHHDRNHRLRLAARVEVEMLVHVHGPGEVDLPAGERFYVVVRQIVPGCQVRHFAPNVDSIDCDVPESYAAALFDHLAPKGSAAADAETIVRTLSKNAEGRR